VAGVTKNERQSLEGPCLSYFIVYLDYYFLENFLRPNPARPMRPVPKRSMVAGSGTGIDPLKYETWLSPPVAGRPEIPQNKNKTSKQQLRIFFMVFPLSKTDKIDYVIPKAKTSKGLISKQKTPTLLELGFFFIY